MFEAQDGPRLFAMAPGVDFPQALYDGLISRTAHYAPVEFARIDLIVNTARMQRRLRHLFDQGPPRLLPRLRLITQLDDLLTENDLPPSASGLRRRLELAKLVAPLLESQRDLGARSSVYALSDSLAALMDEMQGEGVSVETIANLDVTDQSGHWARAQQFIEIAHDYLAHTAPLPDQEARQRDLVMRLIAQWEHNPPAHPVLIAGSTGSRGTTEMLMTAVSRLPQGALILPGFDYDMPPEVWARLDDPLRSEDHPQYRFHHLLTALGSTPQDVTPWTAAPPPSATRNKLISLSLRPAPVTDAWLTDGPQLPDLEQATADVSLIEAPTPRIEALTIAMRLRKAVADGQTAALITPDRMLTRQVTAALDRWHILPDDSAGTPLQLSPPGRFLRHLAHVFTHRLDAETLLTLLRHPLTHSAGDRGPHQLNTQRLELRIRRKGLPYPERDSLLKLAASAVKPDQQEAMITWATWVSDLLCHQHTTGPQSLETWVQRHIALAEALSAGLNTGEDGGLWQQKAGEKAKSVMNDLAEQAVHGGEMSASDYADLVGAVLSGAEVRDRDAPRTDIMIWGTLEARVQGADLVILGGLNEGSWPEAPKPDPWLNRKLRLDAGLLLPERRIGLSAHDYQQAIAAPEVWLTRSIRSEDAQTVPSRWLNRLSNLLKGLPDQNGPAAFDAMAQRGEDWIDRATALEATTPTAGAARPSPRPPLPARPHDLSVTEIKRLIRDPYAIYAKHSLRLRPLNPLVQTPDAPMRGNVVHDIMEAFMKDVVQDTSALTKSRLLEIARTILEREAPWPSVRAMWLARLERVADWLIDREETRLRDASPIAFENDAKGLYRLPELGMTLNGRADRIDQASSGDIMIYDYKTGSPPSKTEQKYFDKQLLILSAMAEEGVFDRIGPAHVSRASFIGLGSNPREEDAPLSEEPTSKVLGELRELLAAYQDPEQGYTSRRMVQKEQFGGDYDQLARFGEWDGTDDPEPEDLL